MYKNIFEELAFKFSHLSDLKPDQVKTKINIFDNLISENFVHNLNPERYSFYMEFMKALTDPDMVKSIMYETKLIKKEKETESKLVDQIVSKINQLYNVNITDEMIDNDVLYAAEKNKLIKKESQRLTKRLKSVVNSNGIDMNANQQKIDEIIDQTFDAIKEENNKPDEQTNASGPVAPAVPVVPAVPVALAAKENNRLLSGGSYDKDDIIDMLGGAGETSEGSQPPSLLGDPYQTQPAFDQYPMDPVNMGQPAYFAGPMPQPQMSNQLALKKLTDIENKLEVIREKVKKPEINKKMLENTQKELNEHKKSLDELAEENKQDTTIQTKINSNLNVIIENISKTITDKLEDIKKTEANSKNVGEERKGAYEEFQKLTRQDDEKVKDIQRKAEDDKKKMKDNLSMMRKDFYDKSMLYTYREKLSKVLRSNTSDAKLKAQKLKDIIDEIENNEAISINALKLSKEDKLVFIGITFLIRLVCLGICQWGLTTNYILNFTHAYILYVILYCIFLLIILVIVNMTFRYPIAELYTGKHSLFTSVASILYFFYMPPGAYMSSSIRIFIHFGIIIFLTMIAILIESNKQNNEQLLNYNYTEKKRIYRTLSNFSLLLWFFTSVIAMWG